MDFKVTGVDRNTGKDAVVIIAEKNEKAVFESPKVKHLLIEKVEPLKTVKVSPFFPTVDKGAANNAPSKVSHSSAWKDFWAFHTMWSLKIIRRFFALATIAIIIGAVGMIFNTLNSDHERQFNGMTWVDVPVKFEERVVKSFIFAVSAYFLWVGLRLFLEFIAVIFCIHENLNKLRAGLVNEEV
jgi:hypothetical protein